MLVPENIKLMVRGLFEDKQAKKELEDSIDKDVSDLKKWMLEHKMDEFAVDDISVTYGSQVRSSMDEGKTIEIIKSLADAAPVEIRDRILGCIHTKEYVDENELERLMYDDVIPKDALAPAVLIKTVYTLNMRRSRKKD